MVHTLNDINAAKITAPSLKRKSDDKPESSWAAKYEDLVRSRNPLKSRANAYMNAAVDPRYITGRIDPSDHVPPFAIPDSEDIDFTVFTADIICKYWSLKNNNLLNTRDAMYFLEKVNASTWIALVAGGALGFATFATLSTSAVAISNSLLQLPIPDILTAPAGYLTELLQDHVGSVSGVTALGAASLAGSVARDYGIRKWDDIMKEKHREKRRKEAMSQYEEISRDALQAVDPALLDLHDQCSNIYSRLCQSTGKCACNEKDEPYTCRMNYLRSYSGVRFEDYLDMPNKILKEYEDYKYHVEQFRDALATRFRWWYSFITLVKPASGEIGLILSIVFGHIPSSSHRTVLAEHAYSLFTWLLSEDETLFHKGAKGCCLTMSMTKENELITFFREALYPKSGDEFHEKKMNILEDVWQDIEKSINLAESEFVNLNLRHQRKYVPPAPQIPEKEELLWTFIPTQQNERRASKIFNEIKTKIADYQRNPVNAFMTWLKVYNQNAQESIRMHDDDYNAWVLAYAEMVKSLTGSQRNNILNNITNSFFTYVVDLWITHSKKPSSLTADNISDMIILYRRLKGKLVGLIPELDKTKWTKSHDVMKFDILRTLALQEMKRTDPKPMSSALTVLQQQPEDWELTTKSGGRYSKW